MVSERSPWVRPARWWPRNEDSSHVDIVDLAELPDVGGAKLGDRGRYFLVNLQSTGEERGGILALSTRCPHLHCDVRKGEGDLRARVSAYNVDDYYAEWFDCPCHGSIFDGAGRRVFGPSPRSLDTYRVSLSPLGLLRIHLNELTPGDLDNPSRAVPLPAS